MDLSAATFPSQFGDALRSIEASCHNFKAHEWSVWTHSLSPLYLKDHLPPDIYHEYLRLVHAIMLATEDTISLSEISEIRSAFTRFLLHYEAQYYQFKWERLSAARSVFHMLAHVADCISLLGPMNVYTQWSMERFCGSIARLVGYIFRVYIFRVYSNIFLRRQPTRHYPIEICPSICTTRS
ncbi:hypothetical protein DFH27DRAFT_483792 [Peziza echinospora]|nr:hypothetical protein DFH27DRAFT_483792 [Peziza echinospora]